MRVSSRGERVEVRGSRNSSQKRYGGNDHSNDDTHGDGDEVPTCSKCHCYMVTATTCQKLAILLDHTICLKEVPTCVDARLRYFSSSTRGQELEGLALRVEVRLLEAIPLAQFDEVADFEFLFVGFEVQAERIPRG